MKKSTVILFAALALLAGNSLFSSEARGQSAVGVKIQIGRPGRAGHPGSWNRHSRWGYHRRGPRYYRERAIVLGPYPRYYYTSPPPVVIRQETPVVVQPEEEPTDYWYYCRDPEGFYPYVKDCPCGWLKVVPETTPPGQ